jgi:hypothetical protein
MLANAQAVQVRTELDVNRYTPFRKSKLSASKEPVAYTSSQVG